MGYFDDGDDERAAYFAVHNQYMSVDTECVLNEW